MATELILARLWEGRDSGSDDLPRVARPIVLALVPRGDRLWEVGEMEGGEFEIEMPLGHASVQRNHVSLRLQGISPEILRIMHAMAAQLELAIINEGGRRRVLLTDSRFLKLIADDLRENSQVCVSPDELGKALAARFAVPADEQQEASRRRSLLYSLWTRHHPIRAIGSGDPEPNVPGLQGSPRSQGTRAIYVGLKPKEGALLQFRRLARYIGERGRAGQALPDGGGPLGSDWQIRLPGGEVYGCIMLAGFHPHDDDEQSRLRRLEQWMQVVQVFAEKTGRRTATIREGQRVVISDGREYAVSECESRRARDEGGRRGKS